jgi:DNA repair ATPase RecN
MSSRYKIILILLTLVIAAFVLFLLFRPKSPDEDKFVEVYIQLSIAQMKFQDKPDRLAAERKKILSEYKYSQKELDRFIKFYQKQPEKWVNLWEKINQRLSELIEREKTQPSR